jgi:hypothetical protein
MIQLYHLIQLSLSSMLHIYTHASGNLLLTTNISQIDLISNYGESGIGNKLALKVIELGQVCSVN